MRSFLETNPGYVLRIHLPRWDKSENLELRGKDTGQGRDRSPTWMLKSSRQ